ncbi:MAG: RRXRR domain-containing protein [Desulfamplus sp.]|nr:RRXRR domain-containing protein [Desulfamplus sp.]
MQKVFVLDSNKHPLTPCKPARARILLAQGKAAVYRNYPFTIILKYEVPDAEPRSLRIKLDPGSKTTGMAVIVEETGEVVWAGELEHRGQQIKDRLDSRRAIRRSRRNRKTRYRKPRFYNRIQKEGWLPPSIQSRVENVCTWVNRLIRFAPIQAISQELVKFDTQKMQNGFISGIEYQQGTLHGYEVREYLLEKWKRTCAYCGKKDVPLEVEHIQPKSKGGTNRISNLTLACTLCNQKKGNQPIEEFLKSKPDILKRIKAQAKAPLKDTASVNASRWALLNRLKETGLPVECGSGGLTKFNRTQKDLPKEHWIDAGCVGKSTPEKIDISGIKPLRIKASGHGQRQLCRMDKFGFPRTSAKANKSVHGFQTGDRVKAIVTKGKKIGTYLGKVAVRSSGSFNITMGKETIQGISWKSCQKIFSLDGYSY